jgi:hypothetical protein
VRRLCPHHAYAPTEHTTHHACTAHTHAYRRVLGKLYQVHAARLHSGAKVVVKLQHVEVARVMRQDMVQSLVLGRLLAFFEPEFDFTSLLTEANREHEKELDFNIEASNLVEVGDNLHRSRVVAEVPSPIPNLVTEKLLVMTFSEGIPLKSRAQLLDAGIDLPLLVARVCEAWAQQMFTDGLFNADPHPGNLLVRNEAGLGPLPVLLDFGLCKRLTSSASLGFCKLVYAVTPLPPSPPSPPLLPSRTTHAPRARHSCCEMSSRAALPPRRPCVPHHPTAPSHESARSASPACPTA